MFEISKRLNVNKAHSKWLGWFVLGLLGAAAVLLCVFAGETILEDISKLGQYFRHGFIRRAFIVGVLVSLCAALLGVSLVLKRFSMIGDGLSHVGFGALTVAMACGYATADAMPAFLPDAMRAWLANILQNTIAGNSMAFTLAVVVLFAFLLLRLSSSSAIKGDSAIAMISTGALALGVLITSQTRGMNTDVYNYLFGSILAQSTEDVYLSVALSVTVLVLFAVFYNKIFAVTFDESFVSATGTSAKVYNLLLAVMSAVTIVVGMRMMGGMLISSLLIFPALTAMRIFKRFKQVVLSAAVISVICFMVGLSLSCLYSFPTGASIVLVNIVAFIIFSAVNAVKSKS